MGEEPRLEELCDLKAQLSKMCWQRRVEQARHRLRVVVELRERCGDGVLRRVAVRELGLGVAWSSAQRWWEWYHSRDGEGWEKLMDRRLPDKPWKTPEDWKRLVRLLSRHEPQADLEKLRQALVEMFGEQARLGDGTLRKVLSEVGLSACPKPSHSEEVVELSGGGGLVLLLAALEQTGITGKLAEATPKAESEHAAKVDQVRPDSSGRDAQGRFTDEYNRRRLVELEAVGGLFGSVESRAGEKDVGRLRVAQLSVDTLDRHLRCLVALPLLTERGGTVGANGPAGAWLEVLSTVAYRAATLDKTLNQLKWLGVGDRFWEIHAQVWWRWSRQWAGEGWRQLAVYVDSSKEAWWTRRFAKSGPVSHTGRVQPCLSRVVLSGGPGVPILAEVGSGQVPLNRVLWPLLNKATKVLGEGAIGRLTVVDAECCQVDIIEAFAADDQRDLITVLKGPLARAKSVEPVGSWQDLRQGAAVREAQVNLEPQDAKGLSVRVVELRRGASYAPVATRFVTTAPAVRLSASEVAEAYLGRWPLQEDIFRRGRNGLGLERTAGYGVVEVSHVALLDKRQSAERGRVKAAQAYEQAVAAEFEIGHKTRHALERLEQRQQEAADSGQELDGRHSRAAREALELYRYRHQDTHHAEKRFNEAQKISRRLAEQPDTIYVRDTALDSISTCLKMVLLALLEFVCQEYLGGYRLTPRTFIEAWIALPVTIRQSHYRVIYEIAPNPRDPTMTRRLEQALGVITERKLRYQGRLLVALLRDEPKWPNSG